MLTTVDNPYSPLTDFKDWYTYDIANGYNTSEALARLYYDYEDIEDETMREKLLETTMEEMVNCGLWVYYNEKNE